MQSKNVKELHSNFLNFSKCDGDIKYMTLTDLLSLLKKNELCASILSLESQRLIVSSIYLCICCDNGDLQDLSIQCLPYMTIQFNNGEMIDLSLKLCKHLQKDLASKKDDEEKYNAILRECIVITSAIKSMCTANRLLVGLQSEQRIPTPHLMSSSTPTIDSPLLLPKTPFIMNDDGNINEFEHESISRLIESLSSLLLNIIASKQQSMRIEFTKHLSLSFEHYHEQILFALDILLTIIDNHGQKVSFIFDSATNVLFNLLSGAHHDYVDHNKKINDLNTKILESKKVNKKAIQCLGSLSRFLPNNELKQIINTLCLTCTKCTQNKQYSTLKNIFDAISKISKIIGLNTKQQERLCLKVINVIQSNDIKQQIEVREYGLMALETLIKNTKSSNIISLFPKFINVIQNGLRYDPNYVSFNTNHNKQRIINTEHQNDDDNDWTDDDDDDSWGNNDDDDGFTNDLEDNDDNDGDIKMESNDKEDLEEDELNQLDELNQNLDDDDDDSWKVRRASNKCLLAMIDILIETKRDFNPNMFRLIKEEVMNTLLLLLNIGCCERVKRIKINIFETYNTLLLHLNDIYHNPDIYITLDPDIINTISNQIADKEYLNEVLMDDPDVYHAFFTILTNIITIYKYYNKNHNKYPLFIPYIVPLSISTISHYTNPKWNGAISQVFKCCSTIYSNTDYVQSIDNGLMNDIFSLSIDIGNNSTSNDVLSAMFECMAILSTYLDNDKQEILLKQCIHRLQQSEQQQNVINSTAACLTNLVNKDTLQIGMKLSDELMMTETTRLNGIKLSISCIKSLDDTVSLEQKVIESIIRKFSSFLKQNALNVRFVSLDGLVLTFNKYHVLCKHFVLSLSEMISLLKNIFALNESCHRLKQFISVLIYLFDEKCNVLQDKYDIKSLFNVFVLPLLECVTHSAAIHPVLYPLWTKLWSLIGLKLQGMMNDDTLTLSFMNSLHDKLIGSNLIMSTSSAKFHSCWCAASLFNHFLNKDILSTFFMQWIEEEKKDNDDDEDGDMEPMYSNTAAIEKEINDILLSQLLLINNTRNTMLDKYRDYVHNTFDELCVTSTESDASTYISSCYLSQIITDRKEFMNLLHKLSVSQTKFALNTLSKVIEGICLMENCDIDLLIGDGLHGLIQFIEPFTDTYFVESATVISHLLCNTICQNETFKVIDGWLSSNDCNRYRLALESLTSALITIHSISSIDLIHTQFIENVMALINNKDLTLSESALKCIKVMILSRIKCVDFNKLLFILLNRTKSSSDYMDKISFGPITKLVDTSSSVRCLSFEVITDIIEYNNEYISSQFIDLCIQRLMDALRSNDSNLVNAAIQSFQILIRSGLIVSSHITKELIECISQEIDNCKGSDDNNNNNKMDSNKKEKLAHLLHFYAVIRKSISNILSLEYCNETWNQISSLITQIEHNPSFLTRTPSTLYNENMEIGQPLLLSPSLRAGSVSALQRDNSLQYLEPLHQTNINNKLNHNKLNDTIDLD